MLIINLTQITIYIQFDSNSDHIKGSEILKTTKIYLSLTVDKEVFL